MAEGYIEMNKFAGVSLAGSTSSPVSITDLSNNVGDGCERIFYIDRSDHTTDYPTALTSVSATLRIFVRITKYSSAYSLFEVTAVTVNVRAYSLKGLKINNTMYWQSTAW